MGRPSQESRVESSSFPLPTGEMMLGGLLMNGLLGAPAPQFTTLAIQFRRELAPRDLLEALQVDLILVALTLLRRAIAALTAGPRDEAKTIRSHAQAHKLLTQGLREYHRLRRRNLGEAVATGATDAPATPAPTVARPAAAPAPTPAATAVRPRVPAVAAARPAERAAERLFGLDATEPSILPVFASAHRPGRSPAVG